MPDTKITSYSLDSLIFSEPDMPEHYKQSSESLDNLHTYAIVNGAGSDKVLMNLVAYEPEHRILFNHNEAEELEDAAPWLVKLNQGETYTEWLLEECIGERLLLFMQSPEEIDTLAEHFKHYTKVEFPDKHNPDNWQSGYFSFYDPSIFPAWAKSLNKEEALQFFQPLNNVWYEENGKLLLFYLKNDGWQQVSYDLLENESSTPAGVTA